MSSNSRIETVIKNDRILIEEQLENYLQISGAEDSSVLEGMKYALLNGGKRIRAVIVLEMCKACGKPYTNALPFACALEMIHAYSLVHDDMPCMDDDDMRRGKPSCHKKFGEANALLIGDALLTLAFETAASAREVPLPTEDIVKAVSILARRAGVSGMIGGQVIDMELEGKNAEIERVKKMYEGKTCALFIAAASLGCIAAHARSEYVEQAAKYAYRLGMAFQIMDDILDVTGDEEKLGKPIGSDRENEKCTYVSLMGLSKAREDLKKYTDDAIDALKLFPDDKKSILIQLAELMLDREK